jgi:hypothetical protein
MNKFIVKLSYTSLAAGMMFLTACDQLKQNASSVESSYQKTSSDTVIYTNVVQTLQNIRRDLPSEARLIVLDGRVLLVGYVASAQEHIDTINAIWRINGVKEVVDHLEHVAPNEKTGFDLKNAFIKTQLDTMFLTNSALRYGHFEYVIFKKNLYVLACTSSGAEKDAFYAMVKKTPTIQKVFFYSTDKQ